ncbi:SGNH/GDSL hydrolase family protein [Proteiniphilum sp.]|nr:SGNH/GDSL hydrolase family protein [Proteiniphilum sp.]MEA4916119.1 SGNH/GDSL hydrolase family protein [Proteiniphilum sp.]
MIRRTLFISTMLVACVVTIAQNSIVVAESEKTLNSQWNGKRVAYLGDSMTDPDIRTTDKWYWQFLKELMNIDYTVYAKSGFQWDGMYEKAKEVIAKEKDSIDAIFIWAGTNDYNMSTIIGDFFTETIEIVNYNGKDTYRKHRTPIMTNATFCGRINKTLSLLKENYPDKQIIILTPIHRGDFTAGSTNVQPNENYANGLGLYHEAYVEALKKAGTYWSVPVIDLHGLTGIFPVSDAYLPYCASETDRLHPNTKGHYRIAKTIQYQLLALPGDF